MGSFKCICARGYRRDNNNNCISKWNNIQYIHVYIWISIIIIIDINECAESNTTCDINSRCEDRNGSFSCCIQNITTECIGMLFWI